MKNRVMTALGKTAIIVTLLAVLFAPGALCYASQECEAGEPLLDKSYADLHYRGHDHRVSVEPDIPIQEEDSDSESASNSDLSCDELAVFEVCDTVQAVSTGIPQQNAANGIPECLKNFSFHGLSFVPEPEILERIAQDQHFEFGKGDYYRQLFLANPGSLEYWEAEEVFFSKDARNKYQCLQLVFLQAAAYHYGRHVTQNPEKAMNLYSSWLWQNMGVALFRKKIFDYQIDIHLTQQCITNLLFSVISLGPQHFYNFISSFRPSPRTNLLSKDHVKVINYSCPLAFGYDFWVSIMDFLASPPKAVFTKEVQRLASPWHYYGIALHAATAPAPHVPKDHPFVSAAFFYTEALNCNSYLTAHKLVRYRTFQNYMQKALTNLLKRRNALCVYTQEMMRCVVCFERVTQHLEVLQDQYPLVYHYLSAHSWLNVQQYLQKTPLDDYRFLPCQAYACHHVLALHSAVCEALDDLEDLGDDPANPDVQHRASYLEPEFLADLRDEAATLYQQLVDTPLAALAYHMGTRDNALTDLAIINDAASREILRARARHGDAQRALNWYHENKQRQQNKATRSWASTLVGGNDQHAVQTVITRELRTAARDRVIEAYDSYDTARAAIASSGFLQQHLKLREHVHRVLDEEQHDLATLKSQLEADKL